MKTISFDPVLLNLGPLQIRWYGLMYVMGFLIGGKILQKLAREKFFQIPPEKVDLFVTYQLIGMFFGARFAYVFIYNWDHYVHNLSEIFAVWHGGLSFHGAILGFALINILYSRQNKLPYFQVIDNLALAGTQGLFFGRIGNFINGELYGRVTNVPWGMIFQDAGPYPRHPSQLYEAFLEGIVLFIFLWLLKSKVKIYGIISSSFLIGYGLMRYIVEFFREPDTNLGYYFGGTTTMGQILCLLMILVGFILLLIAQKRNNPITFKDLN